jgi:hypothetical protein
MRSHINMSSQEVKKLATGMYVYIPLFEIRLSFPKD